MEKSLRFVFFLFFWFSIIPLFAQISSAIKKTETLQQIKPGMKKGSRVIPKTNKTGHKQKLSKPLLTNPPVVISSYFKAAARIDEWTEFLVVADNTDLRGWQYQDNNGTQSGWQGPPYVFKPTATNNLWANLRAGTIIMVWSHANPNMTLPHLPQVFKNDGYIEVTADDPAYFTGGAGPTGNVLWIAIADILRLMDPTQATFHALGHNGGAPGTSFGPLVCFKLNHTANLNPGSAACVSPGPDLDHYGNVPASNPQEGTQWTAIESGANVTFGLPNKQNPNNLAYPASANSDYWRSLRQPGWTAPTLSFTYDPNNTKVTLTWNAAIDLYPSDKTQGYMIVRNTVNTFGIPVDGWTYNPGEAIVGGGTVIDTVNSSLTVTRIDNTPVPCTGGFYYRVYAFRYTKDFIKINGYDFARGRAYNETNFASGQALYPAPVAPTSATSTPNSFCAGDPPPASILLEAPGGSGGPNGAGGTLNWYVGGCGTENGGTLLGPGGAGINNPYTLTPAPTLTTTYYARWENSCSSSSCVTTTVTVNAVTSPAFAGIGPLCQNSIPPALPGTSVNGITGTWSPLTISTTTAGISTYTFTPNPGQCASPTTMNITITAEIAPTFVQIGPLCQNSTPPALPNTSTNGVTGTWVPPIITTTTIGTTTYTFTPAPGQCSPDTTMDITISSQINPTFLPIGPFCQNSVPPPLPNPSTNGMTGTWVPPIITTITTGTTPYTFTPDGGQCGKDTTINITISLEITPAFTQIGPLCQNSSGLLLPPESINGITGTWDPSTINTTNTGTTSYTFTPDAGQCGVVVSMQITIDPEINPTFAQIGPLCQSSIPPSLPTTSTNGITGMWVPATISTATVGTSTYIFTPAAGQCSVVFNMDIDVSTEITPTFAAIGAQCQNSTAPPLLTTSLNGITGSWNPATINTATTGTTTYTFTPGGGQCAIPTVLTITVNSAITPTIDITGSQTKVCEGTMVNFTSVVTDEGTTPAYQWLLNGSPVGTNSPTYSYTPADGNQVWCQLTSSLACATNPSYSDTITISVSQTPHVTLSDQPYLCSGTPSQLDAGPDFTTYQWQDGSTDRYYSASAVGQYWVSVTDTAGCVGGSDTVTVKVCETGITVPTAFSPNNDGVNDVFKAVATLDENSSFSLSIIDRWGETVFESHSFNVGWDGTFNGQPLPPGIYAWEIIYQSVNSSAKPTTLKGTVTLVR